MNLASLQSAIDIAHVGAGKRGGLFCRKQWGVGPALWAAGSNPTSVDEGSLSRLDRQNCPRFLGHKLIKKLGLTSAALLNFGAPKSPNRPLSEAPRLPRSFSAVSSE